MDFTSSELPFRGTYYFSFSENRQETFSRSEGESVGEGGGRQRGQEQERSPNSHILLKKLTSLSPPELYLQELWQ